MMAKLPWVLLGISVIFNFTFAGGFLQARSDLATVEAPEGTEEPAKMVADELNLDEDQRKAFAEIRAEARTQAEQLRESIVLTRQELWSKIASGSEDAETISELDSRLSELYQRYRAIPGRHLRRFLDKLDPSQRKAAIERIRDHDRRKWGYRRLLERFDSNGDGRLDAGERDRARKAFRPHRGGGFRGPRPGGPHRPGPGGQPRLGPGGGMHHPRGQVRPGGPTTRPGQNGGEVRRWLIEKYDADGDGKVDEAERARAREALRRRWSTQGPPHWAVKRFDADGDGRLDDAERKAAEDALRGRFRRGPAGPMHRNREPQKHHPRDRG